MKKLVGIAAVTALVAAGAFADVSVGFYGHGSSNLLEAYNFDSDTNDGGTHDYQRSTAAFANEVEISAENEDSTIGFYVYAGQYTGHDGFTEGDTQNNPSGWEFTDEAKAWAKLGWLKFSLGKLRMNELVGSISDWDNGRRDVMSLSKTDIFDRFDVLGCGIEFTPTPIKGLWLGLAFDAGNTKGFKDTGDFFRRFRLGAGYGNDKFQIKAAWINDENNDDDYIGKLELGFDLNLGESALLEIGAKIPLWSDGKQRTSPYYPYENSPLGYEYKGLNDGNFFQIVAGLKLSSEALAFKAHAGFAGLADFDDDGDRKMAPGIFVDASLECAFTPLTLGVNLAWNGAFCEDTTTNILGAALYVKKDLASGCFIHAGIADKLDLVNFDNYDYTKNIFYIPVGIEYAF